MRFGLSVTKEPPVAYLLPQARTCVPDSSSNLVSPHLSSSLLLSPLLSSSPFVSPCFSLLTAQVRQPPHEAPPCRRARPARPPRRCAEGGSKEDGCPNHGGGGRGRSQAMFPCAARDEPVQGGCGGHVKQPRCIYIEAQKHA